jgi:hypothetical protein
MMRRKSEKPATPPAARPAPSAAGAHEPRAGAEAVPPGTVEQHTFEQESGYGGKKANPRKSADQRTGG